MSVRVFVSSPSDVPAERKAVERVAARVTGRYDHLEIEVYRWEANHYFSAHTGFQEQIEEIGGFDLIVGILWSRLGSPLPKDFGKTMPAPREGTPYTSGTAFEILEAIEIRRQRDNPPPDILVYRKTAPTPSAAADNDYEQERLLAERKAVNAFFEDFFASEETGFRAAFQTVADLETFEAKFEADLEAWLRDNRSLGRPRKWRVEERGTPFRGLDPFDAGHREVFFGRRAEIERAQDRLTTGSGFLLVDGASGTGKSSLVRAGLLPRLQDLNPDLRVATTRPETAAPMNALCEALFAEEVLPELSESDFPEPKALARHFLNGGDVAPVQRALDRAKKASEGPAGLVHLVLLVDQCEALFTDQVTAEEQTAYGTLLERLIASGKVQVVATLRGNAREAALAVPPFERMINGAPGLSLGPPAPDAFGEIVRGPADAAGLAFERNGDGVGLDEVLLEEVARDPDALPLLQFALDQLYARAARRVAEGGERLGDVPDGTSILTLTHADYHALGGLSGAIGAQADAALAKVTPAARERLAPLVRELTAAGRGDAVLGRAPTEVAAPDAEGRALVDALIDARVLLRHAPTPKDGAPKIDDLRFTHERVLKAWDRARDAVEAAAQYLRIRGDLVRAEARWRDGGTPHDLLLPAGLRLAEAEEILRDFGPELDRRYPQLRPYIQTSGRLARRRQRLSQAAAAVFAVVALAAVWFGYQSQQNAELAAANQRTAEENAALAEAEAERAEANAAEADAQRQTAEENAELARAETERAEDALAEVERVSELRSQALAQVSAERDRATRNFETAKTAIDALIFDIAQGLENAEGLQLDSIQTILSRAETAINRLLEADPENTRLLRSKAAMLTEFSDVYAGAGDRQRALDAAEQALQFFRELLVRNAENTVWQRDVYVSLTKIGDLERRAGDLEAAHAAYAEGLEILRRLAATDPGNTEWQRDVSVSLNRIGNLDLRSGEVEAARAAYSESLEIARRLAATDPGNTEWQRDVYVSLTKIGDLERRAGDLEAAHAAYAEGLEILRRLAATDPGNTEWQRDVSVSLNRIGNLDLRTGNVEAARSAFTEGLEIVRRLAASDPGNKEWQRGVSISLERIGDLNVWTGDVEAARTAYTEGLEIRRRLAATDPGNTQWQRDVSVNLNSIGDLDLRAGDVEAARAAYAEGLEIRRRLAATDPGNTQWQSDVSVSLNRIGNLDLRSGEVEAARAAYSESLEIARRLAATDPGNTEWQRDVSVNLTSIGDLDLRAGDVEAARAAYAEGLEIRRGLAGIDPKNVQGQGDIVYSLVSMSQVQSASEAIVSLTEALEITLSLEALGMLIADQANWPDVLRHEIERLQQSVTRDN